MVEDRTRKPGVLAPLVVALALALSACGGGGGDAVDGGGGGAGTIGPTEATLDVSAAEFAFTPGGLRAPADAAVAVRFSNAGTIQHDFTIDEANLKVVVAPGETGTGTFALAAGTYTFYCSVPGHREAGMEGTLTVS